MRKSTHQTRPNILLILVDQMAYDCIHAAGHPAVVTPNLDELAASGAVFSNAYCNSPLCAPARACIASGLLVRHNGVFDNGAELSAALPTVMHHLRLAGYRTVGAGKFHFIGPDQLHGFEERLTTDVFPSDFSWTPDWSRGPTPATGVSIRTVKDARVVRSNKYLDYDKEVLFRTLEWIRRLGRERENGRGSGGPDTAPPFFLNVSFTHPHPPFEALERYHALYDGPLPEPRPAASEAAPNVYDRWMRILNRQDELAISREEVLRARRCYYAMVSYVDELVGRIMGELDRMGLLDDTVVVFSSDHGEMLGERGMWFKRMLYEPAVRVPLLVSWPGRVRGGIRIGSVVSQVDLTATLMELAGVPDLERWTGAIDGDSFLPLLTDRGRPDRDPDEAAAPSEPVRPVQREWKDEALFEYYGKGTVEPLCGIRRGPFKYVVLGNTWSALFDLERDPGEETNLAGDPVYAEQEAQLREALLGGIDLDRLHSEILRSQQRRIRIREAMRSGKRIPWDHQPFFDASKRYVRS